MQATCQPLTFLVPACFGAASSVALQVLAYVIDKVVLSWRDALALLLKLFKIDIPTEWVLCDQRPAVSDWM